MDLAIAAIIIAFIGLAVQVFKFFMEVGTKKDDHFGTFSKKADVDKEIHNLKSKISEGFERIDERFDEMKQDIETIQPTVSELKIGQAVLVERVDGITDNISQKLDDIMGKLEE